MFSVKIFGKKVTNKKYFSQQILGKNTIWQKKFGQKQVLIKNYFWSEIILVKIHLGQYFF